MECRICLTDDNNLGDFMVPCKCIGTNKYIHQKCLDLCRTMMQNSLAYTHCTICLEKYRTTGYNYIIYLLYKR